MRCAHPRPKGIFAPVADARLARADLISSDERRRRTAVERHATLRTRARRCVAKVGRQIPYGTLIARVRAEPLARIERVGTTVEAAAPRKLFPQEIVRVEVALIRRLRALDHDHRSCCALGRGAIRGEDEREQRCCPERRPGAPPAHCASRQRGDGRRPTPWPHDENISRDHAPAERRANTR